LINFSDSNLHEGYFCYNCIYWINAGGGKCMIVEESGHDVLGKLQTLFRHVVAARVMRPITVSYMIQGIQANPQTKTVKEIRKK
jgi:hypothetical protein